ncbi:MAG: alcohol dehydrogenase catalytic domain-containing protein [Nitrososphaeria archaeon]
MKAMVLHRPAPAETDPLKYEDYPTPTPKRGEALIRVISCGVCHSNLHMIEGDWVKYGVPAKLPIIPGHEIIGKVVELGEGVENFRKGDIVGAQPLYSACGRCEYCLTGNEHLCNSVQITGETVDGGYAEYFLGKADYMYKVPDNIDPETSSPLFCPGVTAYRASKLANLGPGKKAYVLGIGGVGHVALQTSKLFGSEVIAVSTSESHAKLAEEMGADKVVMANRDYSNLEDHYEKADSVIVFSPSQKAIDAAIKLAKKQATVVIGVFGNINDFRFPKELIIRGSVVGSRKDMQEVLSLASKGLIKLKVTKFKLEEANEVLKKLKGGEIVGRAVLLP